MKQYWNSSHLGLWNDFFQVLLLMYAVRGGGNHSLNVCEVSVISLFCASESHQKTAATTSTTNWAKMVRIALLFQLRSSSLGQVYKKESLPTLRCHRDA